MEQIVAVTSCIHMFLEIPIGIQISFSKLSWGEKEIETEWSGWGWGGVSQHQIFAVSASVANSINFCLYRVDFCCFSFFLF